MKAQSTIKLLSALLLAGLSAVQVQGVATFRLDDGPGGAAPVDIFDGQLGVDLTPAGDGKIIVSGFAYAGIWTIDLNSQTKPAFGSATDPRMVFTTIDVSSLAGGTLSIQHSEVGYGPVPTLHVLARAGGTFESAITTFSAAYNTYADAGNALFSHATPLTTAGPFTQVTDPDGSYDSTVNGPTYPPGSPFSLTQELLISHSGAGNSSHTVRLDSIPEGGTTLVLLGAGLAVLAMFGAGRKSVRA